MKARLTGVERTLLYTLYFRALDARSAHPIVGDAWAEDVLARVEHTPWKIRMAAGDRFLGILRARKIDDWTRAHLAAHPDATVLHLGCGLDSRVFRLDPPPTVRWYDVDYPDVIELRRELYPERVSTETVPTSVTAPGWLERLPSGGPVLVVAEGLFMYLREPDIRRLLQRVAARYPTGQVVFDTLSPWLAATGRLFGFTLWPLADPRRLERWDARLHLVEEIPTIWSVEHLTSPLFRLAYRIPALREGMHLLRYRLGTTADV
jgi:O-methyltransferase